MPHFPELLQKSELNSLVMISTPMEASFFVDFVDYTRIDTVKDHVKSKKPVTNKEAKRQRDEAGTASSTSRQVTLESWVKSKVLNDRS